MKRLSPINKLSATFSFFAKMAASITYLVWAAAITTVLFFLSLTLVISCSKFLIIIAPTNFFKEFIRNCTELGQGFY